MRTAQFSGRMAASSTRISRDIGFSITSGLACWPFSVTLPNENKPKELCERNIATSSTYCIPAIMSGNCIAYGIHDD